MYNSWRAVVVVLPLRCLCNFVVLGVVENKDENDAARTFCALDRDDNNNKR